MNILHSVFKLLASSGYTDTHSLHRKYTTLWPYLAPFPECADLLVNNRPIFSLRCIRRPRWDEAVGVMPVIPACDGCTDGPTQVSVRSILASRAKKNCGDRIKCCCQWLVRYAAVVRTWFAGDAAHLWDYIWFSVDWLAPVSAADSPNSTVQQTSRRQIEPMEFERDTRQQ